jgi:hypothetical protein
MGRIATGEMENPIVNDKRCKGSESIESTISLSAVKL